MIVNAVYLSCPTGQILIGWRSPRRRLHIKSDASPFDAIVVSADEPAIRHAERRRERREDSLVDGLTRLEPVNRRRQHIRFPG